ncbi:MAG TPA: hypothetical protein VGO52_02925 [Hyphomonadaceae bacterium]|jgi:hypothetical protein|nr:hypothetical protein [Hyphomonadaceae bacterium]
MTDSADSASQQFLLAMYKENADHGRHHEILRQQSTTLLLTISGAAIVLESGFLSAALSQVRTLPFPWLLISICGIFGLFVVVIAFFGRALSLRHYRRNRASVAKARAFRTLLEERFPDSFSLKELRDQQTREAEHRSVFQLWANIYLFVAGLGALLTILPIGIGTLVFAWPPSQS